MDGHITIDDRGIARIGGTRSRVVDVVLDRRAYGWTPEQIHEQYPHLSLAQIHAAFAYYYDHQAELDEAIAQGLRRVEEIQFWVSIRQGIDDLEVIALASEPGDFAIASST